MSCGHGDGDGEAGAVSWSPDGTRIASGSYNNTVRVWDVATGTEMVKLEGHTTQPSGDCCHGDIHR